MTPASAGTPASASAGTASPADAAALSAGWLIVLVGPAGAGKTTLAQRLRAAAPDRRAFSVSHTTRPRRDNEVDGRDYWFVDRSSFEALRDRGAFAETAEVHANLYGTSLAEIARIRAAGQDALFDIDIFGAHNIWRLFPDRTRMCFLLPPSWTVLVERLTRRGTEDDTTVRRRLRTARLELQALRDSPAPWHLIINDSLDASVAALEAVCGNPPPPSNAATGNHAAVANHPAVRAFLRDAVADPRAA